MIAAVCALVYGTLITVFGVLAYVRIRSLPSLIGGAVIGGLSVPVTFVDGQTLNTTSPALPPGTFNDVVVNTPANIGDDPQFQARMGFYPIDAVGWGDATNAWVEGAAALAPAAGSGIERRPPSSSTS